MTEKQIVLIVSAIFVVLTIIAVISGIIPFTYGMQAIRQINMVGAGLAEVWPNLLILVGSIIGLILISIPVLKREVNN